MSNSRVDSAQGTVQVAETRKHEGPRTQSDTPFRQVLAGGANALLTGAEVATGVLGGPVLAAAVREAKTDMVSGIAGTPGGAGGAGGAAGLANAAPGTEMEHMRAMQRESHVMNLQMLELQESVSNENRQFSTVSNVMKAKADTVKAVINNIHS